MWSHSSLEYRLGGPIRVQYKRRARQRGFAGAGLDLLPVHQHAGLSGGPSSGRVLRLC